ncbi:MAG: hypothetical protein DYG89_54590 [Caldilinea sp. CFX5]|nr:hypothetical protein [Caldilinea sp. CFX5]
MDNGNELQWPLIIGMGALALIRPFLNISGLMDRLGRPAGPLLITLLISVAWLAIVVYVRVDRPILTLLCTGLTYGIFALVISTILSPVLTGQLAGPITNAFATVSVLITNAIWGGVVGLCAWVLLGLTNPRKV